MAADHDERGLYVQTFDALPVSWKIQVGRRVCEALDQGGRIPSGLTRTVLVGIYRSVRAAAEGDRKAKR